MIARFLLNRSDNELLKLVNKHICIVGVSNKSNGREKVKGENTHNRLGIDSVSALYKVNVIICENNHVYELSDILYAAELDINFFHKSFPLKFFNYEYIIAKKIWIVNRNMSYSALNLLLFRKEWRFFILAIDFLIF